MLQVQQISKTFGETVAVESLSLSIGKGQICGLLGPNGAGKSTALRMICGVLAPNAGQIVIDGVDLLTNPRIAKQSLGYVPEGAPLPLEMIPIEYMSSISSLYGLSGKTKKDTIFYWANRCEIEKVLHKPIGTLSRGYRQRVAFATALLHHPSLLILDEPTTGLDPSQRATFHEIVHDVATEAAILYSSHHLAEVESSCNEIAIIHDGKLIAEYDFGTWVGKDEITVEVSSSEIANALGAENVIELEFGWVRCNVNLGGEEVVEKTQNLGGKIRLIQPASNTLETKYLELIQGAIQ
jgi:ABC-2 type transport system ATP-binding protein